MISLLVSLVLGEVMWGERAQKSCFDYDEGKGRLSRLPVAQCAGAKTYYRVIGDEVRPGVLGKVRGKVASDSVAFPWKHCRNHYWSTTPFDKEGRFSPQCAPDTLYSWQDCSRIEGMVKSWSRSHKSLGRKGYLYTWRTPVGSWQFGSCVLRIKLKSGIKFIDADANRRNCYHHAKARSGEAVIVSQSKGWHEYIICNPEVIESWSTGTALHLDEMRREIATIRQEDPEDYDRFRGVTGLPEGECYLKPAVNSIAKHVDDVAGVMSRMGVEDGYVFPETSRDSHFKTKDPSYFNPRGLR